MSNANIKQSLIKKKKNNNIMSSLKNRHMLTGVYYIIILDEKESLTIQLFTSQICFP